MSQEKTPVLGTGYVPLGQDTSQAFHIYGFEWTPSQVRFFFDGIQTGTLAYASSDHNHNELNIWLTSIAAHDLGVPVSTPGVAEFDYFRYYEQNAYYIDNGDPGYTEFNGGWADSALPGWRRPNNVSGNSRYSFWSNAAARWTPNLASAGLYQVYVYQVVNPASDPAARIDVVANGSTTTTYINYQLGQSGWTSLGTYFFQAGTGGYLQNTISNNPSLNTAIRADAVKFVKVAQTNDITIDNGQAGYAEFSGGWADSALPGSNGSGTRYSFFGNAFARWTPSIAVSGDYQIYIYKIVHSASDPNAKIDVVSTGPGTTNFVNYQQGVSSWVPIGTSAFYFQNGAGGYVQNTISYNPALNTAIRTDAVKFVRR